MQIDTPSEFIKLCTRHSVSPELVIQQFIRDLCSLEGSSGSDERGLARLYYDRCGYSFESIIPEQLRDAANTLLDASGMSRP
jgi:hypothetical protein